MSNSGLIVRRTERFEISLPARVRVAMHHIDSVQFAKGVTGPDRWMSVDVVDFSGGGVGFVADIFFPRALDLEMEIPGLGESDDRVLLRCGLHIKRVQMTDRRPAYLIGCAFNDIDQETQGNIDSLIDKLTGHFADDQADGDHHA